jgi:hypothetical protein
MTEPCCDMGKYFRRIHRNNGERNICPKNKRECKMLDNKFSSLRAKLISIGQIIPTAIALALAVYTSNTTTNTYESNSDYQSKGTCVVSGVRTNAYYYTGQK